MIQLQSLPSHGRPFQDCCHFMRAAMPFPETRWSWVMSAKSDEAGAASKALAFLSLAYWQPIYTWIRGQGRSHEEVQNGIQGFVFLPP